MEEIEQKLQNAGLTGNESKVYLELIKKGELPANKIAKNLGIDRTLTYTILSHLIEKGQISYIIKSNKKFFTASDPENLLNPIKSKEVYITDLIIKLKEIKKSEKSDYEINIYEGKEGLRTLMKKIIQHKEFLSFGATGRAYDSLYELSAIAKEFEKRKGYSAKIIMNKKYRGHDFTKHPVIKTKFTDAESEASTTIFGDYVSIHLIKEKPVIILIKNKEISEGYRNYFEVLWEQASN